MDTSPLLDNKLVNLFSYCICAPWMNDGVHHAEAFKFTRSDLLSFLVLTVFCSERFLLCQWAQDYPHFSLLSNSVDMIFMLRSLIHLLLSFVHGDKYGIFWILLHNNSSVWTALFIEDAVSFFFPRMYFCLLYQNSGVLLCVDLCLHLCYESLDQCVCFSGNFMLLLLEKLLIFWVNHESCNFAESVYQL